MKKGIVDVVSGGRPAEEGLSEVAARIEEENGEDLSGKLCLKKAEEMKNSALAVSASLCPRRSLLSSSIAAIASVFGVIGKYFLAVKPVVPVVSSIGFNCDMKRELVYSRLVLTFWRL
jgi:hypothetical protein